MISKANMFARNHVAGRYTSTAPGRPGEGPGASGNGRGNTGGGPNWPSDGTGRPGGDRDSETGASYVRRTMSDKKGLALLMSVLIIFLLTTLGSAYMISAISEKDMAVNQSVATTAIFSADAGVEVALQQLTNHTTDKLQTLINQWPDDGPIITDPENFFPGGGFSHNWTEPIYAVTTSTAFIDSVLLPETQNYDYYFTVRSTGIAGVFGRRRVRAEGKIRVTATRGTFADFLLYTDQHLTEGGSAIWFHTSGDFDGRVHSNTILRYAYFPTFRDFVTSADPMAWYYNNGNNVKLDADRNGDRDVPSFFGGVRRNYTQVELPTVSHGQLRASLGLNPSDETALTEEEIRNALGIITGDPATPPPEGVYVLNNGTSVTAGVFVQGDVNELALSLNGNGHQVMSFKHSNGDIVTVTTDDTNNTTTVNDNGLETTYQGNLPSSVLYTRGANWSLYGPDRVAGAVQPAIERDTKLTIVSVDDVVITSDIAYEDYEDGSCVLGIYSAEGNVRIGTAAPDELVLDTYVLASGVNRCFTVDNYGSRSYAGQVHLRGGVSASRYGAFGTFDSGDSMTGYGRDFRYDRRGFVPPFWPEMVLFVANDPQPQMLLWVEE